MIEDERGVKGDPTRPGRRFMKRGTKGDASETGLVRFLTPVLMQEYGGPIECTSQDNALDQIRENYPMLKGEDGNEFQIPFSSSIKFNMIIRDANPAVQDP